MILDTNGNIFGGFTPVEWESSPQKKFKADDSEKSFLFTLKNPHNVVARRFGLKAQMKQPALYFPPGRGPQFPGLWVYGNCNAHTRSNTIGFGATYTNDTGLDGDTFFAGSMHFQVREMKSSRSQTKQLFHTNSDCLCLCDVHYSSTFRAADISLIHHCRFRSDRRIILAGQ
jgi:hypothetical protein